VRAVTITAAVAVWFAFLQSAEISWSSDLIGAIREAKRSGKPLMVLLEGRYCRWCKKLDKEVLHDDAVVDRARRYIAVRIERKDAAALSLLPPTRGVPTVFFLSPQRKVLATALGYYNKEDFLSFFDEAERKLERNSEKNAAFLVWYDDIDAAFDAAKRQGKRVVVMVEDAECRWCKKVKRESLSKPEVQRALRRFVLLKISRSDHEAMRRLPGLKGPIPSFHLFNAEKEPLEAIYGYFDANYLQAYFSRLHEEL